jgi:hypothetical protein
VNLSTLVLVGNNGNVIWEFGAGVLGVFLLVAVLVMGVEAIKRFLDAT